MDKIGLFLAVGVLAAIAIWWFTRKPTGPIYPGMSWPGGGPSVVSMDPLDWNFRYGSGISGHPFPAINGFMFAIPSAGDVDYLTTDVSINAKEKVSFLVEIVTTGTPLFRATDGGSPASFGVMLEARNDDLVSQDGRWWSRLHREPLGGGVFSFELSLTDLDEWSNVLGRTAASRPEAFRAAIANLGAVGFTFGATAFGHGVRVEPGTGTAVFALRQFDVR